MSFRVVRSSKFRHVFGKEQKKDNCYDGLKISRNAWDSTFTSVNNKFLAVCLEAQGGGAFLVIPITQTGRVDLNQPKVTGHQAAVLDVQFCPFNDNMIASASEDCVVKIWDIPDGGLTQNLEESLVDLEGHQRRVGIVNWHPTAENVIMSAGFDYLIYIWDIATASALFEINCHADTIFAAVWNFNGSLVATTCKDKQIRVIDPRKGTVISEGKGHDGTKSSKIEFVSESNLLFTTGFSRMSERQYAIWDGYDLSKAKKQDMIDQGSGVLFTHYDEDTRMMYVAGKGDGNVRYFEIVDEAPYCHFLSEFKTANPQRGIGWLPKTGLDINGCEVMRMFKLHPKGTVEPISFTVPRKSTLFQDDVFPPTRDPVAVISASDWAAGGDKTSNRLDMREFYKGKTSSKPKGLGGGVTAVAAPKPAGLAKVAIQKKATPAPAPAQAPAAVSKSKPAAASAPEVTPTDEVMPKTLKGLREAFTSHVAEIKALKLKVAQLELASR